MYEEEGLCRAGYEWKGTVPGLCAAGQSPTKIPNHKRPAQQIEDAIKFLVYRRPNN